MRRIKVSLIGRENVAINTLGFIKPARAMQLDRLLQFRQV
jgi:hypothetical protein